MQVRLDRVILERDDAREGLRRAHETMAELRAELVASRPLAPSKQEARPQLPVSRPVSALCSLTMNGVVSMGDDIVTIVDEIERRIGELGCSESTIS